MPRIEFGRWAEDVIDWLQANLGWLFDGVNDVLTGAYDGVSAVLAAPDPLLMAGILAVLALWLRGPVAAVLALCGFLLIDSVELWDQAMDTMALVLVASVITVALAVPLGIWGTRNRVVSALLRPLMDFMQTMPAFVYLIPGVVFFSVGVTPGLIATVVFSMPPGVRMTELGIRQVDAELVEAAEAFGTSPRDTLVRVQLPLALPTIMAGINQVIMLALSMVVIAGMAGAGGLGETVYAAVTRVNVALGFESGLAVVILAMYLDRMTSALNQRVSPLGRRAMAKAMASASGRAGALRHYRPGTTVAMVGVVVLALVASGVNLAGSGGGDDVADEDDVGRGKRIDIGYIPWDEGVASTYLWKELLERRGYRPRVKQLDPGPLYSGIAEGDVDFQTDAWLPTTHANYWKKYGARVSDLGSWYGPTSLELAVPSYVKGVDSLADLRGKGSTFGGRIVGIESSAGMMGILNDTVVKEYGLDGEYEVVSSSTSTMLAQLDRSIKRKQPVVVTLWTPHWAYSKYDLKKLKDPEGAWGSGDELHTVASTSFVRNEPTVTRWLKDFRMSEEQLASLEDRIHTAGEGNEEEAVGHWLHENPELVEEWVPVPAAARR